MPADFMQNIFNFLARGEYNTTLPTVAAGSTAPWQVDSRGRILVRVDSSVDPGQSAPRTKYISSVAGSSGALIVGAPKKLVEVMGHNRTANARFLHLFDQVGAPTSGASVPKLSYRIDANAFFSLDYSLLPHDFAAGIYWAVSTTAGQFFTSVDTFFLEATYQDLS